MKKIQIKSKDEINPININYVEPEDIENITVNISSYIVQASENYYSYSYSYIYDLQVNTENKFDELNTYYDDKFYEIGKKINDLSYQFTYTVTYNLPITETDYQIMNNVEELDERLSYALRYSNKLSYNYNSETNSRINQLQNYINQHIEEVSNIPVSYYWTNY